MQEVCGFHCCSNWDQRERAGLPDVNTKVKGAGGKQEVLCGKEHQTGQCPSRGEGIQMGIFLLGTRQDYTKSETVRRGLVYWRYRVAVDNVRSVFERNHYKRWHRYHVVEKETKFLKGMSVNMRLDISGDFVESVGTKKKKKKKATVFKKKPRQKSE